MPSVLIIEDDEEGRRAVARLFGRADWKVFEAADGDTGIELALRNRPEVILCDLLMPKSNGFQVCRTIREKLQPTKIIVVSGRDYAVDRASALEAGADEFLLKPITWEVLQESIDRLLTPIPARPNATASAEELGSVPPRIKLWGVRGSLPVPGPATNRYGGNTSCVEVRADGEIIVLDAGTGIRGLGLALEKELGPETVKLTLLITHTHWDHIQGLPFFVPIYNSKNVIRILSGDAAVLIYIELKPAGARRLGKDAFHRRVRQRAEDEQRPRDSGSARGCDLTHLTGKLVKSGRRDSDRH